MNLKMIIILCIGALGLSGCAAATRYHWGNYENALYSYYKKPSEIDDLSEKLSRIITDGEKQGKVPPGIYAEYGYILHVSGKHEDAVIYYKKEKEAWPESRIFMDKMINLGDGSLQ
jgi:hypothetical protein